MESATLPICFHMRIPERFVLSKKTMLNRAPYNTEVPQFLPSRDAPINSYIIRKYPCQEHLAGKTNQFGTLTWKIQQPDSSMVWQSVKVVMPMEIECKRQDNQLLDMNINQGLPACNVALSQSPMNAFRQTSLSINGRIFSEDNYYRDVLDACYRGVGTQAYGDNHSLKPICNRNLRGDTQKYVRVKTFNNGLFTDANIGGLPAFAHIENVVTETVPSAFTLLEHNGPFIERARIFQDNLSYDGKKWSGDISHLLELGPFQARARKGNTAVPYIQDFHLRLNFQTMDSKFDVDNPATDTFDANRTLAPKLLEFATLPNFLHKGEVVGNYAGWPAGYNFKYTKQPYLEVVYTKHESPMRDSYNLRCFEHQYEKSNRFTLLPTPNSMVSPTSLQRVTTRLLSLPTKVYIWAEVSDEYKYAFVMGGVRRSCRLDNLHLRVNQRPDVMFNPSQEECYEMFRRHTNSSLEYGSWLKSPIYCFDMVDVGQPDMYSNDARIAWFEWDAEVSLTPLQIVEQIHTDVNANLETHGYDRLFTEHPNIRDIGGMSSGTGYIYASIDYQKQQAISSTDHDLRIVLSDKRDGTTSQRQISWTDGKKIKLQTFRLHHQLQETMTSSDFLVQSVDSRTMSLDGFIWARVQTTTQGNSDRGWIVNKTFYYIPESKRFILEHLPTQAFFARFDHLTVTADSVSFSDPTHIPLITAVLFDNGDANDNKSIGQNLAGGANWAPGNFAYKVDGMGIQNATLLVDGQALPRVAESADNKVNWVCFAPSTVMPFFDGAANWLRWKAVRSLEQLATAGCPDNWKAQTTDAIPDWGFGSERNNVAATGVWGTRDPEVFNDRAIINNQIMPWGAQLVWDSAGTEANPTNPEYQLKTLYEFGNCQYNFQRNAAPTRILPNVVPVGPSSGIPAL